MKAIKAFLKKIWEFISSNAWIQPLLFVAVIFLIILGIQGIGSAVQKGKLSCSKDDNSSYRKTILMEDVMEMIDADESFLLYIGKSDCAGCASFEPVLKRFSKDHSDVTVYFLSLDTTSDQSSYKDATMTSDNLEDLWAMITPHVDDGGQYTPTVAAFKTGDCVDARYGGGQSGMTVLDLTELNQAIQ